MKRSTKGGRTVTMEIDFWYEPQSGAINVATKDQEAPTFHIVVTDDPTKPNGHPTLFERLKKALQDKGAPAPAQSCGNQTDPLPAPLSPSKELARAEPVRYAALTSA